ncbi:GntR family transcriptional regulator [Ruania alba]|uniref:DNA-binding transcriptional regulator, GntR family n=1 Tax=Ruania alba TaxID=648782 RepID=A0A1H5HN58_9MICO|nr:GntR family transcriptional regulator [Ruania alba]SEE29432.1 DNA-binding transcriptional regulator, GntR family [Ruania alba]
MKQAQPNGHVRKRTLSSVITSQLRQRITDGTYPPGSQLNEVEIAKQFSTSRGPVREGMQRLVQEGLLVSHPHRGVFVPVLTYDDVKDLLLARAAIERAAMLELSRRGLPAATIASLEQVLGQMAVAIDNGDWSGVASADLQFHEEIVHAAGSPRLSRMYGALIGEARLGINILVSSMDGRSDYLEEHRRIFDMLTNGDRQALLAELDRHIGVGLRTIRHELGADQEGPEADLEPYVGTEPSTR